MSAQGPEPRTQHFSFAATALAKQMMETTKDAATNARTVLQYALPESFDQLADEEAKQMVERGNFYGLASYIVEQFEAGQFPTHEADVTTEELLEAFRDAPNQAIEEGSLKSCTFTQDYMAYMKALAKEKGVKGKNLFHPVRLALTGEMSGQDVTKQLSLLALADRPDSVINAESVGLVPFPERMSRLKKFCETFLSG